LIPVDILSRIEEQESQSEKKGKDTELNVVEEGVDRPDDDDESSVAKRIKRRRTSSTTNTADSDATDSKLHTVSESKKNYEATDSTASSGPVSNTDGEILPSTEFEQDILEEIWTT